MKILKKILLVTFAIIAIVLVTAAFLKKEYTVQRQVVINKPPAKVFNYIKYLRNQDNFSKWATMDPAMKKAYKGTDGTVGFVSSWESEQDDVGKGEQTITKINEGKSIDFKLHFIEPFEGFADATMSTEAINEETKVIWSFHSKMPYPFNIMSLFMDMDKMVGDDLQQGLNNLKAKLEADTI